MPSTVARTRPHARPCWPHKKQLTDDCSAEIEALRETPASGWSRRTSSGCSNKRNYSASDSGEFSDWSRASSKQRPLSMSRAGLTEI